MLSMYSSNDLPLVSAVTFHLNKLESSLPKECILLSLKVFLEKKILNFVIVFFSIISLGNRHDPSFEQNITSFAEIGPVVLEKINTFTDRWAINVQYAIRQAQVR